MEGVRLIDSLDIFPVDEQSNELPSPIHLQYTIQQVRSFETRKLQRTGGEGTVRMIFPDNFDFLSL